MGIYDHLSLVITQKGGKSFLKALDIIKVHTYLSQKRLWKYLRLSQIPLAPSQSFYPWRQPLWQIDIYLSHHEKPDITWSTLLLCQIWHLNSHLKIIITHSNFLLQRTSSTQKSRQNNIMYPAQLQAPIHFSLSSIIWKQILYTIHMLDEFLKGMTLF